MLFLPSNEFCLCNVALVAFVLKKYFVISFDFLHFLNFKKRTKNVRVILLNSWKHKYCFYKFFLILDYVNEDDASTFKL